MNLWNSLKKPIIGLAPMDGITDEPMRYIQASVAKPDVMYTEFVNVEYVFYRPDQVLNNLIYSEIERPIVAQLSGHSPDLFYQLALIACFLKFDGIDINMGCPMTSVTRLGGGAKLIGNEKLSSEIVFSVQKAINDYQNGVDLGKVVDQRVFQEAKRVANLPYIHHLLHAPYTLPISIKTRTGLLKPETEKWLNFLSDLPIQEITLHGRSFKEGYSGTADWEEIGKGARTARKKEIIFLGNGDIKSRNQATEYSKKFRTDGALIARGALGNPWVFSETTPSYEERLLTMKNHAKKFYDLFGNESFVKMRKHFGWYPKGVTGAKELKVKLQEINTFEEFMKIYPLSGD